MRLVRNATLGAVCLLGVAAACDSFDSASNNAPLVEAGSPRTPESGTAADAGTTPAEEEDAALPSEPVIPDAVDASADVQQTPVIECTAGFTDAFDRVDAAAPPTWELRNINGKVDTVGSGDDGDRVLRAVAFGGTTGYAALLRRVATANDAFVYCLQFRMRVSEVPAGRVSGPRLMAWNTDRGLHQRAGIAVDGTHIHFEQGNSGLCPGQCSDSLTRLARHSGTAWQTVVVRLEVDGDRDRTTPPYGKWNVWIDGVRFAGELGVALGAPTIRELRFGIGYTSGARAELQFDDLVSNP